MAKSRRLLGQTKHRSNAIHHQRRIRRNIINRRFTIFSLAFLESMRTDITIPACAIAFEFYYAMRSNYV